MWTINHVLQTTSSGTDLVESVLVATSALRTNKGLSFAYSNVEERPDGGKLYTVSETNHGIIQLRVIQDDVIPARYLEITAENAQICWDVGIAIEDELPFRNDTELVEHARRVGLGAPGALLNVAIATHGLVAETTAELFITGLRDADPAVRKAAVVAISLVPERRFVAPLRSAMRPETIGELVNMLDYVANLCESAPTPDD